MVKFCDILVSRDVYNQRAPGCLPAFTEKGQDHTCVVQKGLVIHRCEEGAGILFASDTEEFRTMLDKEVTHAGNSA